MITKTLKYIVFSLSLTMAFASCDDLLEPAIENQKTLEEAKSESATIKGLLINAYSLLPGYYDNSEYATDDAVTNQTGNIYSKIATGSWTAENNPLSTWKNSYGAIQYINLFLQTKEGMQYVKNEAVNKLMTIRLEGEAYALRAIHTFFLLRAHAGKIDGDQLFGVQLFDEFLETNGNFNIPRSSFQDCVNNAIADLDKAAQLLPMTYGDVTSVDEIPAKFRTITTDIALYNRAMGNTSRQLVDGLIVEAFRSRLLLLLASPAFVENTANWTAAANAAATVIDYAGGIDGLAANGHTYYTNTSDISNLKEGSNPKEIIWRENYADNNSSQEKENYPPTLFGNGQMNPTQNLVDAFPAANGYPISDSRSGYNAADPYANRDPRLDLYIIHNGSKVGPASATVLTGSKSGSDDGIDAIENKSTRTGYYMKKRLRMDVNCNPTATTGQRHYTPRLRYTEFFLNYAEAANEAFGPKASGSHAYSAYDVIKAIRQRAGITDTDYLDECAANKDKMRELIRNERRLELCFESFRFWDLRRWNANLNETARGLDVNDGAITPLNNVEVRAYKDYMYYGPIPQSEMLKFSNLQQNKGWQ